MINVIPAFVLVDAVDWRNSDPDHWNLESIELDGSEKLVGHRQIDGSICKVFVTVNNKYIAITKK